MYGLLIELRPPEKDALPAMRPAGAALAGMCALCKVGPRGALEFAGNTRGDAAMWPPEDDAPGE
jgi:hypothetical protein